MSWFELEAGGLNNTPLSQMIGSRGGDVHRRVISEPIAAAKVISVDAATLAG